MEYEEPRFYQLGERAARADRDVIDMVSGDPDWGAPPGVAAGLRAYADLGADDPDAFQYPPCEGLTELRAEIADRCGAPRESVIVTNGAGEANHLALAAALDRDAGEEVVLTDPVYPYYPGKVALLGGTPRYVETGADGALDPDDVRAVAGPETACIVANTPNNPTGAVYDAETMRELVEIAEKCDAVLVSDETYREFVLGGAFASAAAVDSPHRVVTGSFSKSLAITGFRVGYGVFPPALAEAARTRHMLANVTGSRPAQYAVLHALRETDPEYYSAARDRLRERIRTFGAALDAAGATHTEPDGGFYVMAKFPGFPGTIANAETLIEEAGVAAMPGETFGSAGEWFRFALVTPRVETAGERLRAFFAGESASGE